jgi:hypothetical protein
MGKSSANLRRHRRQSRARDPWPTDWSGPSPEPPPDRSQLNLTLFALLMVGLTVWFSIHLQPWLGEVLVLAGPLTLWAIWKLLQSWLDWGGLSSRAEQGTRKLLARPAITEPLIVALGVVGLMFLTTSSIYLEYGVSGGSEDAFKVSVLADGKPFLDHPLRVTSSRRTAGRPFFGRLFREKLQFVVGSPLYEPRDVGFWPGQSLRLEVPKDFKKKSFHLLLLVPGINLLGSLPAVGQTQAQRFYLEVEVKGQKPARIGDLHQQIVYTGASAADLERLASSQPDVSAHAELERYLAEAEVPAAEREGFYNAWAKRRLAPTPQLREGDKIRISIGCEGRAPFHKEEFNVGSAGAQVHIVEVGQVGC